MDCKFAKNLEGGNQIKTHHLHDTGQITQWQPVLQQQPQQAPLLPIDDFYMLENPNKYSEEEKQLRIKLTAVYRLIEQNGWSMGIYNHVTVSMV